MSNTFSTSIEMITWFFSFYQLMWWITLPDFLIHSWDQSTLVIMYYFSYVYEKLDLHFLYLRQPLAWIPRLCQLHKKWIREYWYFFSSLEEFVLDWNYSILKYLLKLPGLRKKSLILIFLWHGDFWSPIRFLKWFQHCSYFKFFLEPNFTTCKCGKIAHWPKLFIISSSYIFNTFFVWSHVSFQFLSIVYGFDLSFPNEICWTRGSFISLF